MNGTRIFTRSAAVVISLIALIVLSGWQMNIPEMKSFLSRNSAPMVANSAISFLSCGIILFLSTIRATSIINRISAFLSTLIILIGSLTLVEYLFDVNLGIDQLLFTQPPFAGDHAGRMSIISSFNFILVGTCLLIETQRWNFDKSISQYILLLTFFTTLYPFAGTIFGAVHVSSDNTIIAIPSAICFFLIVVAYFVQHRDKGWASMLFEQSIAGVLIRRILIPLAVLYPIFSFLSLQGEKAALYNTEGSAVFMMVSTLALFTIIVLITAQTISRLDDEKDQYKKFFELSSEVLMIAGPDSSIKLVSNAFTKVLGYSRLEGVDHSFFQFVQAEEVARAAEYFEKIRRDPSPGTFQLQMKDNSGSLRHFLWSYAGDPKKENIYAAGYDITEIKEAEQVRVLAKRLTLQNEQLASFAHIVSHNLRSHVGNLNSLLHLHKVSDPTEREVLFGMFEKVSQHLSGTLNDLIESLRIKEDIGKARNLVYFEQILTKTREILSSQILESQAVINFDFKVKSIAYPKTYLESIFLNLLSNAIKYRSPSRQLQITLTTDYADEGLLFTVSDNGQGINMSRHGENLFGFYKTFHGSKDAKGIGLFITRTQIEAMGGTITAESEEDKGTTFKVILQTKE